MKPSRLEDEQIIQFWASKRRDPKMIDAWQKRGIGGATFGKWKAKHGGLGVSGARLNG